MESNHHEARSRARICHAEEERERYPQDPGGPPENAKGFSITILLVGIGPCHDRPVPQGKVWMDRLGYMLVVHKEQTDKRAPVQGMPNMETGDQEAMEGGRRGNQ